MSENAERANFEKWFTQAFGQGESPRRSEEDDGYLYGATDRAWRAWTASRKLALEEAAQKLKAELDHAAINDTYAEARLGQRRGDAAVRSSAIEAVIAWLRHLIDKQEGS